MSLKHHVLFPLLSAQTDVAGAKNASPRCHEGVTNEFDWRWCVLALRIRRLIPDYGHFDLQLCDQLFDVVKELGLADKVSPFWVVTNFEVIVEYQVKKGCYAN